MSGHRTKHAGQNSRQNQLRIIGGIWRGRKFSFPDAEGLRPTGDRIRETLFNWLAVNIQDALVVDLFAGSGALGIEAVSRGAREAHLVEMNHDVANRLSDNLALLKDDRLKLSTNDALTFLDNWQGDPFDVVFLDPPFHSNLLEPCFDRLHKRNLLAEEASIYVESDINDQLPSAPSDWQLYRERTAGNVCYRLFRRN